MKVKTINFLCLFIAVISTALNVQAQNDTIILKDYQFILCDIIEVKPPHIYFKKEKSNTIDTLLMSDIGKISFFQEQKREEDIYVETQQQPYESIKIEACDEAAIAQAHEDIKDYSEPSEIVTSLLVFLVSSIFSFLAIAGWIIWYYVKRRRTTPESLTFIPSVKKQYRSCKKYMKVIRDKVWEVRKRNFFFAFLLYIMIVMILLSLIVAYA